MVVSTGMVHNPWLTHAGFVEPHVNLSGRKPSQQQQPDRVRAVDGTSVGWLVCRRM